MSTGEADIAEAGEPKSSVVKNEGDTKEEEKEELPMEDITDPKETDVLCGRGGAALRHPGNQTYRRLVNLNKKLYITCLKTEKLKISRSIVAAIREQNGRFLERDSKKGTWFDIGDKKAIEKTSQALREGQPKLRQKMIEVGQIAPDQGMRMEHQFGNGIYNPRGQNSGNSGSGFSDGGGQGMQPQSMQFQTSLDAMPPPPSRQMSTEMNPDVLMQRLSLGTINPQSIPSWTPSLSSMDDIRSVRSRLRPSLNPQGSGAAHELGMGMQSNLSVMSDFSSYGMMNDSRYTMELEGGPLRQQQFQHGDMNLGTASIPPPPPPPPDISPMMASPSIRSGYDRRRFFAKMKYRPPSSRTNNSQQSMGDGMPDIHMVDSQFSLMSNLSGHGSSKNPDPMGHSDHGMKDSEMFGVGSRRSLMSGLSRISDTSDLNSVFSDMGRKIGTSSRSIAMSEISIVDDQLDVNSFDIDTVPSSARGTERAQS